MPGNPIITLDPDILDAVREGMDDLSRRETEVLRLATSGLVAKEIGVYLGIEHESVNRVMQRIRERLGVRSLVEAAAYVAAIEARERKREGIVTHF